MPQSAHNDRGRPYHHSPSAIGLIADNDLIDRDLRAYLRAPYDPLNSARATRFIARGLLQLSPAHAWMRPFAFLVAFVFLLALGANVAALAGLVASGNASEAAILGLQTLIITGPPGAFGAVLLWRLLRGLGL